MSKFFLSLFLLLNPDLVLGINKPYPAVPVESASSPPPPPQPLHPALKYGPPLSGNEAQHIRIFDGFVAAFDSRTRNPSWVLEHIYWYDDPTEEVTRKKSEFKEDLSIEERFRNRLNDFKDSGYDRGHLAPAANHRKTQKAMNETFTLTNISPQVGTGFNRDYWARFEKFTRDLVKLSAAVFIVTGPLWLPDKETDGRYSMKYPMIGQPPALISVPTHFYKVILAEPKDGGDCALASFVMPNRAIPPDVPLSRFAVPISDLEAATGLTFFSKYLTNDKRIALDKGAIVWRSIGKAIHGKGNVPLLETLEGSESTNTITKAPPPREKSNKTPIEGKKCSLEPHLCYHTECVLPPAQFWKKQNTNNNKKP